MRISEKILFDTLKLNLKILEVNWVSLEQNPPNKRVIDETISQINKVIQLWDKNNMIVENYYNKAKKGCKQNETNKKRARGY